MNASTQNDGLFMGEYRYIKPRAIEYKKISFTEEIPVSELSKIYCLDSLIPENINVLGLMPGSYPYIVSLIIGREDFGLRELVIKRLEEESRLPFHCISFPITD